MAKGGGRRLCRTLRVVADSIEKSVFALGQLLAEVWWVRRAETATLSATEEGVDSLDV